MIKKFGISIGTLVLAALFSLCFGATWIAPGALFGGGTAGYILQFVRIPRTVGCLLAGAALGVSGGVIQRVLRNPLASPGILGVNAGAGLAVTVCCAFGIFGGAKTAFFAFLGALCAVFAVLLAAEKSGASRTTVILGGVAVNAMLNAISDGISVLAPEAASLAGEFRVGGFAGVTYGKIWPASVGIGLSLAVLMTLWQELDLLLLGEEIPRSLGLNVRKYRYLLLGLAAVLAGCAVSLCGLLGFVGLMIPHFVGWFLGAKGGQNGAVLVPMWAIWGATAVTISDTLSRCLFAPYEMPVGILMSAVGGPVFLWLLRKQRGGRRRG